MEKDLQDKVFLKILSILFILFTIFFRYQKWHYYEIQREDRCGKYRRVRLSIYYYSAPMLICDAIAQSAWTGMERQEWAISKNDFPVSMGI